VLTLQLGDDAMDDAIAEHLIPRQRAGDVAEKFGASCGCSGAAADITIRSSSSESESMARIKPASF